MTMITDREAIRGRWWRTGDRVHVEGNMYRGMWRIVVPRRTTHDPLYGVVLEIHSRDRGGPLHMWSSMLEDLAMAVWPKQSRGGGE